MLVALDAHDRRSATLAVIAAGIELSATHEEHASGSGIVSRADSRHAAMFAVGAALAFGVGLHGTGRLSADLPIAWLVLPARLAGTVAVALPLLVARRSGWGAALPRSSSPPEAGPAAQPRLA